MLNIYFALFYFGASIFSSDIKPGRQNISSYSSFMAA